MKNLERRTRLHGGSQTHQNQPQSSGPAPGEPLGRFASAAPAQPKPAPATAAPPTRAEVQPPPAFAFPVPQVQAHQAIPTSEQEAVPAAQRLFVPQGNREVSPTPQVPTPEHVVRSSQTVPDARQADVTVILYSGGLSSNLLSQQLQALRRQTVAPAAVWCHVDGTQNHDEKTLSRLTVCRTTVRVGRYFRLELARSVATRWVAILDEDTIPGPRWLERAIRALETGQRMLAGGSGEEPEFGPGIVAAAGSTVLDEELQQPLRQTGPEMPREDQELVSFGRQGWVFHPEFARVVCSMPRAGVGPTAFAATMGAAAWSMGLPTLVLPYGMDRADWGAVERSSIPEPSESDAGRQVALLMQYGWRPSEDPMAESEVPPPLPDELGEPHHGEIPEDPNEPEPESPDPLPGVDPHAGWSEKVSPSTTTREKVLTAEEARALGMDQ